MLSIYNNYLTCALNHGERSKSWIFVVSIPETPSYTDDVVSCQFDHHAIIWSALRPCSNSARKVERVVGIGW